MRQASDIYSSPVAYKDMEIWTPAPAHRVSSSQITESGSVNYGGFGGAQYDDVSQVMGLFTGSTIPGTMPMPRPWKLDYYALRERSWQAYTENETASAFIDRLRHFVINKGLKFQYEPSPLLETAYGITISDDAREWIEQDFAVFASSPAASLCGTKDLHTKADEAYLNMLNAGDLLVILHVVNGDLRVQHIDGGSLVNPWDQKILLAAAKKRHVITNGVEYDRKGREVAYYVRQNQRFYTSVTSRPGDGLRTERIPAYGLSGRRIAFRPSRNNQRIGPSRGKPLLTATLQNLEISRRYKLAELLAAEVNAMIVWAIEHDELSYGENPLGNMPNGGGRHTTGQAPEMAGGWSQDDGDSIAGRMTNGTPGMAINLGRGQKLKATDTKRPNLDGAAFLEKMDMGTSASASIPHEIARMVFSQNYSASRAALGMFELIVDFERKHFTDEYYSVIARERQRLRSLQGKIPAPDAYKNAIITRDEVLLSAIENYRYTGVVMPDVDPLKEAKAARERIAGNLSTHDRETEKLGTGDFDANVVKLQKENEQLDKAGLLPTLGEEEDASASKNGEEDAS